MHSLARESEQERLNLFRAASQKLRVHEAIIEKDFWVCWVLDHLFAHSAWKSQLAFKGGTSLSKAYGVIERFSEDIDLVLDWQVLGFEKEELLLERTATKQAQIGAKANALTSDFLQSTFVPALVKDLSLRAGTNVKVDVTGQNVSVFYPKSFSLSAIQPQILLEIGPIAAWIPHEERSIQPYAAQVFGGLFKNPTTSVRTIAAERTFWEKATILHQEAHRDSSRPLPRRYSRHYYDLYRLSCTPIRGTSVENIQLLHEVVEFKKRFYPSAWANYDAAKPGTLRLLPIERNEAALKADYQSMKAMLFGAIPTYEEIVAGLAKLESEINSRA